MKHGRMYSVIMIMIQIQFLIIFKYFPQDNNKKNLNNILMMEIDGKITTHHQTIAEKFNNYYISVADNFTNNNPINDTIGDLNKINPLNYLYSAYKQSFTNIKMKNSTTDEIQKIIKELKSKKSCGYDEITTKILKISSPFIVSPLTYMYVIECLQLEHF
jgi:hypothetical protein